MSVTYSESLATARLNLVVNALGMATAPTISTTGTAAGKLVIGTSALSGATGVLVSINLSTTPATVSGRVLTLSGTPLSGTATADGTAAKAELRKNDGTVVVSDLTVGTAGTDIIIASTAVTNGQSVQVTSGTITHP